MRSEPMSDILAVWPNDVGDHAPVVFAGPDVTKFHDRALQETGEPITHRGRFEPLDLTAAAQLWGFDIGQPDADTHLHAEPNLSADVDRVAVDHPFDNSRYGAGESTAFRRRYGSI